MSDVVLAVDLGGTNMRMATVCRDGTIIQQVKHPTPKPCTPEALIGQSGQMADDCRVGLKPEMRVVGVAYGVPANVTFDGVLRRLPNLPLLEGHDLKSALVAKFGVPATIENDATAAAIGEHWLGASKGVRDVIMITLGTGVGGGIILNGEPFHGADGTAGKLGHICVEPDGHPCGCGSHGCIEQYASATAIERMATEAGLATTTSFEVYEAAEKGDERARVVFKKMGTALGLMLAGLINCLNPEMIVIGGGAATAWDAFIGHVTDEIAIRAFDEPAATAKIVRSTLGDDAGILGAARTAFLRGQNRKQ